MASPIQPLADFLPYVLPEAPSCPAPTAEFQLRMAAIEFCERTRCWRHLTTVAVSSENRTIAAPALTSIHEFEEVTHDGRPLTPTQFTDTEASALTGELMEGPPKYITQTEPGLVTIFPYQAGTLRISMFLKPQHGTLFGYDPINPLRDSLNVVPQFMLAQHAQSLAHGALARILRLPNEPWTDPGRSQFHAMQFEKAIGGHFSNNLRGQQRAPVRVKAQWM